MIYFAHPISDYGTSRQAEGLDFLRRTFSDAILNPDDPIHQAGYKAKGGMEYFANLVACCAGLVFRSFPTRPIPHIGAGVGYEIDRAQEMGIPVMEMIGEFPNIRISPISGRTKVTRLSIEETRDLIRNFRENRV